MPNSYDAVVVVSFGGPESREEVIPFLENVLRGRNVPRERMLEVAEHYYHFGGRSPINDQNRALIAALREELRARGGTLPVYWGNRNWRPFLSDTIREMEADGVRRALAFCTSAYSSYSGCRQYLDDIDRACAAAGPSAPQVDKLRAFYNHPGFVAAMADRVRAAFDRVSAERRGQAAFLYTAHSVPLSMAEGCPYVSQLHEACRLISAAVGIQEWQLVFQSRSGPPGQSWLGPDIMETLEDVAGKTKDVVVVPVGFISDHMEVVYDLDTEAAQLATELGLNMVRAGTVGTHPAFISMISELIAERTGDAVERRSLGDLGAAADLCPPGCCPYRAASIVSPSA